MNLREFVNSKMSTKKAFESLGMSVSDGPMYCPFHDDSEGGHKSAKYYEEGDFLHCFSERRQFLAYEVLTTLGNVNRQKLFTWAKENGWEPVLGESGSTRKLRPISKALQDKKLAFALGRIDFHSYLEEIRGELKAMLGSFR